MTNDILYRLFTQVSTGSTGSLRCRGSKMVGGMISVTDPVSDPVFVASARTLLLLLAREYATLESVGYRVLYIFTSCCQLRF